MIHLALCDSGIRKESTPLLLAFTFDVGDELDEGEAALHAVMDELGGFTDPIGNGIRFTFFVRADNQIGEVFGKQDHFLTMHKEALAKAAREGHEIGWHPHMYRREVKSWTLETDDERLTANLAEAHKCFSKHYEAYSARMGEGFHSNASMRAFDSLGIKADSTALPGRKRDDAHRKFDWTGTPDHPYHPSRADYREPGEDHLDILEVPMTMAPMMASYDKEPLRRYVNLSFRGEVLWPALDCLVRSSPIIVAITHPFELVHSRGKHGLISFDIKVARKNIEHILERCRAENRNYTFATVSQIAEVWR